MEYDLSLFFDQYLRDFRIPTLEYFYDDGNLNFKWINVVDNFKMPIELIVDGKPVFIEIGTDYIKIPALSGNLKINENYYVFSIKI